MHYRYSNEELDVWVPKVQETSMSVKKIYGFFNNHYHGYAPENCLYLLEKLGLLSEPQKKAKDKSKIKQAQLSHSPAERNDPDSYGLNRRKFDNVEISFDTSMRD